MTFIKFMHSLMFIILLLFVFTISMLMIFSTPTREYTLTFSVIYKLVGVILFISTMVTARNAIKKK